MNNSIPPTKSPNHPRKKRLLSQAQRSYLLKDKIIHQKHAVLDNIKGTSSISKMKNKCSEEFQPLLLPQGSPSLYPPFPLSRTESLLENSNTNELKRSLSFPEISSKSPSSLSRSYSVITSNADICISEDSAVPCQSRVSNSNTNYVTNEPNSASLTKYSDSTENISSICTYSRRSSTTTLRGRNNSIDSAFSQISMNDIDIIEVEKDLDTKDLKSDSTWRAQHARSRSDASSNPINFEYIEHSEVFSLPSSFSEHGPPPRKSIFEGKQMVVPTECFFPRPQQGQSLTSFLSSNEFNISAELDRENAHFCISEALIAAIEHMKCTRTLKAVEEEEESDEEIRKLTQRIRIRRKERLREKSMRSTVLLSDGRTDTTSQSASPPMSSHSSDFDVDSIGSEDEIEDLELSAHTESNLSSMKETGLSLSMASLYSDADLHKASLQLKDSEKKFLDSESNNLSAESVALSLIRKFSEKHLPKASDLQWLVSEQEAPQQLLPLPNSWPVSPDTIEEEFNLQKTRLRGNLEWAPPRPQIIFSILPHLKRKEIMEKQKYRCAGCGMKIEKNYVNRFRYCNYFGKYFCQCCHSNSLAFIPGRILWKWNFTKYYVSKFAWNLLDQMFSDPLFNIDDINKGLYQKVRQLELCRNARLQLFYLKNFIRTCRKAELMQEVLKSQNYHIVSEPHMYSLSDLLQVKSGELLKHLRSIVNPCLDHVKQCILCQAKGFICEICDKENDIIFPFELDRVILCEVCGSCFHKCCMKNIKCPRCKRIAERKKRVKEDTIDEDLTT